MGIFDQYIYSSAAALPRRKGFHVSADGTLRPGESAGMGVFGTLEVQHTTFVENEKAAREKAIEKAHETIKTANDHIAEHEKWLRDHDFAKQPQRVNLHDKVAYAGTPTPDRYRGIRGEVVGLRKLGEDFEFEAYVRWPTQPSHRDEWHKQSVLLVMESAAKQPRFKVGDRVRGTFYGGAEFRGKLGTVKQVDREDDDLPYRVQFDESYDQQWVADDAVMAAS